MPDISIIVLPTRPYTDLYSSLEAVFKSTFTDWELWIPDYFIQALATQNLFPEQCLQDDRVKVLPWLQLLDLSAGTSVISAPTQFSHAQVKSENQADQQEWEEVNFDLYALFFKILNIVQGRYLIWLEPHYCWSPQQLDLQFAGLEAYPQAQMAIAQFENSPTLLTYKAQLLLPVQLNYNQSLITSNHAEITPKIAKYQTIIDSESLFHQLYLSDILQGWSTVLIRRSLCESLLSIPTNQPQRLFINDTL